MWAWRQFILIIVGFLIPSIMMYSLGTSSSFSMFDLSISSRSMAKSVAGKSNSLSEITANPAALNSVFYMDGYMFHQLGFAGDSITHFAFGHNVYKGHKYGITFAMTNSLNIDEVNDFGVAQGGGTAQDLYFGLYWGKDFDLKKSSNSDFLGKVKNIFQGHYEFGIGSKIFHSKLLETNTAYPAFDFGMVYRNKFNQLAFLPHSGQYNLSMGVSALNVGPDIKYIAAQEPQPTGFQYGVMYSYFENRYYEGIWTVSGNYFRNSGAEFGTGLEFNLYSIVKLRFGYLFSKSAKNFSTGLLIGYNFHELYEVSAAYDFGLLGGVGNEHTIGLEFKYNRGILQKRMGEVGKEVNKLNSQMNEIIIETVNDCVKKYEKSHEEYPGSLDDVLDCLKEYGHQSVPQPMNGMLSYNPDNGEVKIVQSGGDKWRDTFYLTDGSVVKGVLSSVTGGKIRIINPVGRIDIDMQLLDYCIIDTLTEEEKKIIEEMKSVISSVKENTGRYPDNIESLGEFFKLSVGIDLPVLTNGKYRYNSDSGEILIVNRFKGYEN